jgi:hypothetical protein
MGFEQQVDQWREFYLAVLLGLVFVALSLHLEQAQAPGIPVLAVAAVGLSDSVTTLRRARRAHQPRLTITSLTVPVVLPIGCFGLLVVGGVGVIGRQPYGLYLLAAGSAALIASATRSTWTLLLLGRTQSLE